MQEKNSIDFSLHRKLFHFTLKTNAHLSSRVSSSAAEVKRKKPNEDEKSNFIQHFTYGNSK